MSVSDYCDISVDNWECLIHFSYNTAVGLSCIYMTIFNCLLYSFCGLKTELCVQLQNNVAIQAYSGAFSSDCRMLYFQATMLNIVEMHS